MSGGKLSLLEQLVVAGLDDWVYDAEVCGNIARSVVEDSDDRRAIAIGLIQAAIIRRWVVAGEPTADGTFERWDGSPAEVAARVAVEWMAREVVDVRPGEVVWLENTPEGDSVGRAALEGEPA